MTNPIPLKVRGGLYVVGITVGILAAIIPPVVAAIGIGDKWALVITSIVGAITVITNTLSRANLTEPGTANTPTV